MTTATRTLVVPGAARARTRRPIGRRLTVLTVLAFAVLLILAIGLNLLKVTKVKVMDFILAIFIPIGLVLFM